MPKKPARIPPPESWPHHNLWLRVQEAIYALPGYFESSTNIEGMLATDIFTLNQALSATIEEQVVGTLNSMRAVWDPEKKYGSYVFFRQSQTFPDVLLRRQTDGQDILMGIELKGWYILAKEGEPSFRFTVTGAACNPQDLIVIVPWILGNVLAGPPVVQAPYIELARYAAEQRNYYWQHVRQAKGNRGVQLAEGVGPYPAKADRISDRPLSDSGGNFGRLARYGTMEKYVQDTLDLRVRGIPAHEWLAFFKRFKENP